GRAAGDISRGKRSQGDQLRFEKVAASMTLNLKQKSSIFVAASVALLLLAYVVLSRYYLGESTGRRLAERRQASQTAATRLDEFFARGTARLDIIAQLPLLLNGLPAVTRNSPAKEI